MAVLDLDLLREPARDGVVLVHVSERGGVGDIVDRNYLEVFLRQGRAVEHPTDAAKAVDANLDRHCFQSSPENVCS
jgi:hypothetical protein